MSACICCSWAHDDHYDRTIRRGWSEGRSAPGWRSMSRTKGRRPLRPERMARPRSWSARDFLIWRCAAKLGLARTTSPFFVSFSYFFPMPSSFFRVSFSASLIFGTWAQAWLRFYFHHNPRLRRVWDSLQNAAFSFSRLPAFRFAVCAKEIVRTTTGRQRLKKTDMKAPTASWKTVHASSHTFFYVLTMTAHSACCRLQHSMPGSVMLENFIRWGSPQLTRLCCGCLTDAIEIFPDPHDLVFSCVWSVQNLDIALQASRPHRFVGTRN